MAFIEVGEGGPLYYETIDGDAALPCLVFLHEGLGSVAMWKDFPALLCRATGCPGLVYDRLGYGRSAPLAARRDSRYLHDYALRELPRVLARLLPGRAHALVGHSDGGSIALIYAAQRPALLRAIVTEAAHVFVEQQTLDGVRQAEAAFEAGKLEGLRRYHGDKTTALFQAWSRTWLAPGFRSWSIEPLLASIACPALIVQGREDQYGSEAQVDAIVARAARARKAMLEHCGHAPHQEMAQPTLALMAAFLRAQWREG
ncbi:alpha/beta hydrolase [Janthinobacterium sp.]|uniref:alpha/beta fold hydrolase n=1 Tax=Janthinobacterium sp. TaxID=1871054 RepID=UPI00293D277B|nr:alpha/beta hydrolase [Janthinobacterium sp.]